MKSKKNRIEVESIADLNGREADYNPRLSDDQRLKKLERNLEEFGDLSGIIFNVRTNTIVGGHQRKSVLNPDWDIIKTATTDSTGTVALGYVTTPFGDLSYREVDWDEDKEKAANLIANDPAGEWDNEKRQSIIQELSLKKYDMTQLFSTKQDLNELFGSAENKDFILEPENNEKTLDNDQKIDYHENKQEVVDKDSLLTIKVNLPKWMVESLDKEYGKFSRSEGIRQRLESTYDQIR